MTDFEIHPWVCVMYFNLTQIKYSLEMTTSALWAEVERVQKYCTQVKVPLHY